MLVKFLGAKAKTISFPGRGGVSRVFPGGQYQVSEFEWQAKVCHWGDFELVEEETEEKDDG